jgi:hypothetical protein
MSDPMTSGSIDAGTDPLARAVLYEGYMLYPYRLSSLKNRQRWNFGVLFPPAYCDRHDNSERSMMQTQCLVEGSTDTFVTVRVQFLQDDSGKTFEREISSGPLQSAAVLDRPVEVPFVLFGLRALVEVSAAAINVGVVQLTVRISNETPFDHGTREDALRFALISTQTVLTVQHGGFCSMIDPPEHLRAATDQCRNIGAWPVLIGREGARDRMLSAPIVLYDYPKIAPQSPTDLFDNTEIDEILSLRIQTLTDEEKHEIASGDERARRLLLHTDALTPDQLQNLHGTVRRDLQPGDRVRLKPTRRADIFDLALAGRAATVCSIERDFEDNVYACVVVDDDPGKDLGREGKPGHRFFFFLNELEKL